jgi:hypothetical protein
MLDEQNTIMNGQQGPVFFQQTGKGVNVSRHVIDIPLMESALKDVIEPF